MASIPACSSACLLSWARSESATIAFNIIALKCPACGSYNTRRMGLHTAAPAPGASAGLDPIRTAAALAARRAAAPGAGAAGGGGAAPDALGLMAGGPKGGSA